VLLLTIALNVLLIVRIPKGFFPQQDTGAIVGGVQGPQDASFSQMDRSIQQLGEVIKDDPAVANLIAFTGGAGATNGGFIYIALKPLEDRKVTAPEIMAACAPRWPVCRSHPRSFRRPRFTRRRKAMPFTSTPSIR
jgi:multidrug efflux pump